LIAILDYGSGNLRSAQRAFELTGHRVEITADQDRALIADGLVVPGVGAFGACMEQLLSIGGDAIIRARVESEKPLLGICVGMQILFSRGREKGDHPGVGVLNGEVAPLAAPVVPHIGWNTVQSPAGSTLFNGIEDESFYFVHSFAAKSTSSEGLMSTSNYGEQFLAAIESGKISATQFHPEKSGRAGATLIKNWAKTL